MVFVLVGHIYGIYKAYCASYHNRRTVSDSTAFNASDPRSPISNFINITRKKQDILESFIQLGGVSQNYFLLSNLLSLLLASNRVPRLVIKLLVLSLGLVVPASHNSSVVVVSDVEALAQLLWAKESQDNDVGVDAAHEDADDLAVVVAGNALCGGRQGEALANTGLNGGRRRGDEVAQLVGRADDKGPESTGRQLHQVDGDDSPGALDAELLEEGGGHDGGIVHESVWVEQRAADNAAADDAESTADGLTQETNNRSTSHGAQVGHNLRDGDLVGAEVELVGQHGRVQILAAVAHEVEAGHEQDEVGQQQPVALEGDFAFRQKDSADGLFVAAVAAGLDAHALALAVGLGFGHHETEGDEDDGRAGAEPVQRAPSVRGGVDEAAGEGGGEEVSEGVLSRHKVRKLAV